MNGRILQRVGQLSSVDRAAGTGRVVFSDLDGLVSNPLPILQFGPMRSRSYQFPEVGDRVVCIFLPTGTETGFILGSYQEGGAEPMGSESQDGRWWDDGTEIYYDYAQGMLVVNAVGPVQITAPEVNVTADVATVTAPSVVINSASVQINGNLNVTGTITGGGS